MTELCIEFEQPSHRTATRVSVGALLASLQEAAERELADAHKADAVALYAVSHHLGHLVAAERDLGEDSV